MFLRIFRTSLQILLKKRRQRNTTMLLSATVDPFLSEVSEFWTPQAVLDRVPLEQLNRFIGIYTVDRLENAD